jgi:hypothetical protein
MTLCEVCTVHVETRSASFLVEPQNHGRWIASGLASKPLGRFLIGLGLKTNGDSLWVVWPQNYSDGFHRFDLKTGGDGFWQFDLKTCCNGFSSIWALKPMATVCEWFDLKTIRTVFDGLISKSVATVSGGLTSKPAVTVFSSLALKLVATVSPGFASKPLVGFFVELQNQGGGVFFGLCLKITATVSWFVPQNQVDLGLSVAPQNRRREVGVGHMSRSNGLLRMKTSLTRVSQSGLKTDGDATMCGARGIIVEVASKASWRRMGRCDGLRRTLLPYLYRFQFIRT